MDTEGPRRPRTPLARLEILAACDLHGSISAAARALGISQPTASAGLKALERQLRLTLVTRSARGTTLTDVGRTVASWARDVIDASSTFERGITALQHAPCARVRLAASLTVAEYLAPRWLSHPEMAASETDVELLVRNSSGVMDLVTRGDADLGFIEGPHLAAGLRAAVLMTDTLTIVVRPGHPWARRSTHAASLAEFLAAPLVIREAGSGTRDTLEDAVAAAGHAMPAHVPHLGSTSALKLAIDVAESVTALSALAVRDDIARGALVEIDVPGLDLSRQLRMVWREQGEMAAPVRAIAAFVRRQSTPA